MDEEVVTIHNASPDVSSRRARNLSNPSKEAKPLDPSRGATASSDPSRKRQYQATSPTTGQTRPHSATGKTSQQNKADTKSEREGNPSGSSSDADPPSTSNEHSSSLMPTDLYPLSGFLRIILVQEKALWERNELLLKSLKSEHMKLCI